MPSPASSPSTARRWASALRFGLVAALLPACVVIPPKTRVGALPPAAIVRGHEVDVGASVDTLIGIYNHDWDPLDMGRIEARYLYAFPNLAGDIGGYVSGSSFGFDGGFWTRTKPTHDGAGRWAMRFAPSLTFGNVGGYDKSERYKLPSVGVAADVQWARRLQKEVATSLTFGVGFSQPLSNCLFEEDSGACAVPIVTMELQNRWDFGRRNKPGGWVAGGVQTVYYVPAPVLSGGARF